MCEIARYNFLNNLDLFEYNNYIICVNYIFRIYYIINFSFDLIQIVIVTQQ